MSKLLFILQHLFTIWLCLRLVFILSQVCQCSNESLKWICKFSLYEVVRGLWCHPVGESAKNVNFWLPSWIWEKTTSVSSLWDVLPHDHMHWIQREGISLLECQHAGVIISLVTEEYVKVNYSVCCDHKPCDTAKARDPVLLWRKNTLWCSFIRVSNVIPNVCFV